MLLNIPRAVLFDLDGTLAHTAPDLVAATNKVCLQEGRPAVSYDVLAPHASAGTAALLYAALGVTTDDLRFPKLKNDFLSYYEHNIAEHTQLYPGITALLNLLSTHSISWGIVTNKPAKYTELLVPKLELRGAACIISGDTTAHSKPHPEPLFEAARRLGVTAKQCWYIGDDLRDMTAAHAAGMHAIAAGWGYGNDFQNWNADFIAGQISDVNHHLGEVMKSNLSTTFEVGPRY